MQRTLELGRWTKSVSAVTVGTVVMLVRVARAGRAREPLGSYRTLPDGTRIWPSQVSP